MAKPKHPPHPELPPGIDVETIARKYPPQHRVRKILTRLREEVATEGYLRFWNRKRIADEIEARGLGKVTRMAVLKMMRRVEARAYAEMTEQIKEEKVRQLGALSKHYEALWDAWVVSTKEAQVVRQKTIEGEPPIEDKDGNPVPGTGGRGRKEETLEARGQAGDARYLSEARATLADRRKILGLDAPERREISGPAGGPVVVSAPGRCPDEVFDVLSPDELKAYIALSEKLSAGRGPGASQTDDAS